MKIWLSKNSEVPVREQIITQITLGIASGDLVVGTRLPSTSEIARRYKIHSNTVSNAYQILAEQLKAQFGIGDQKALEARLKGRIREWIATVEDSELLQYDVVSVKDLVFAQLRSWC